MSATGVPLTLLAGCGTAPASPGESASAGTSTTKAADPATKEHEIEQDLKTAARAGGLSLSDEPNRDEQGCVVGYLLHPSSQNGPDSVDATLTSLHDDGCGERWRTARTSARTSTRTTLTSLAGSGAGTSLLNVGWLAEGQEFPLGDVSGSVMAAEDVDAAGRSTCAELSRQQAGFEDEVFLAKG
ncbi:hypothetical protein ACWDFR_18240 [Streptomyces sp. 900105755]